MSDNKRKRSSSSNRSGADSDKKDEYVDRRYILDDQQAEALQAEKKGNVMQEQAKQYKDLYDKESVDRPRKVKKYADEVKENLEQGRYFDSLPDDLKKKVAKDLTMRESQRLSATGPKFRGVFTKNLAKQISIKKRIKQYKEELKGHINDLNESINDGNVRTLEQLLVYDVDDVAQLIFQGDIVETNDAIERLQKKLKSIDINKVSAAPTLKKPGFRNLQKYKGALEPMDEGAKKYEKKKKTIKKKKKKRSKGKKKTKHK